MKKILAMLLSVAIVASLAITGTVAYLADSDSAVNVMTMGEVKIEQNEQKRKNDSTMQTLLEPFTSGIKLYPAHYDGDCIPWADGSEWVKANNQAWKVVADNPNVVDKFVTVENTGKSDAYVRTILAFETDEAGTLMEDKIHYVYNAWNITDADTTAATWDWEWVKGQDNNVAVVEIGGAYYNLYVGTYTGILESGKETIPSLKQVYMDKSATNEDVAKFGSSFEILAFSQAVQANGFEKVEETELGRAKIALNAAFGEITSTEHPWSGEGNAPVIPVYVSNAKELADGLANGDDVNVTDDISSGENNGSAQVGNTTYNYRFGADGSDTNSTLDMGGNDTNFSGTGNIGYYVADGATLTLKNVGKVSFTNNLRFVVCGGSTLNIMDGEYSWPTMSTGGKRIVPCIAIDDSCGTVKNQSSTVNIYGGTFTFNSSNPLSVYTTNGSVGSFKIYGGTFDYDVTPFVAEGYQATADDAENPTTWTVTAKPASETPAA